MMKYIRVLILSVLMASSCQVYSTEKPVSFNFRAVAVSEVVQLIYGQALRVPFVLDPDALTDMRPVAFRYSTVDGDLHVFVKHFLTSLGYTVEQRGNVHFIKKRQEEEVSKPADEIFLYTPKFRSVSYLSRTLAPLFQGRFTNNRSVASAGATIPDGAVPDGSAAALIDQDADVLVFAGSFPEVSQLERLLPQVDLPVGQVEVRGLVYEVSDTGKKGSAFGLLSSLLSGKLNVGIGTVANAGGSFLQIKAGGLEAIYSMLSTDSRFKVVSSPSLRIQSGERGMFSVGQEVPVLAALSYPQGAGHAVQSVEYRSAGVIFDVQPKVRGSAIDLRINQQLSNYTTTTTGVNNSPTLLKREIKTAISLQDGDVIVLGGLNETKESNTRDGLSFLPSFLHTKSQDISKSDIILVMQVQKVVPNDS